MRSMTAYEALLIETKESFRDRHFLYRIYDAEITLYVGRSSDPYHRLHEHLGIDGRFHKTSAIGELMIDNSPDSLTWMVDFYTLADCKNYLSKDTFYLDRQYYMRVLRQERTEYPPYEKEAIELAEFSLMQRFRPYLNKSNVLEPRELPDCYTVVRTTSFNEFLQRRDDLVARLKTDKNA